MDKIADQQIEDATNKIKIATDNYEMINKNLRCSLEQRESYYFCIARTVFIPTIIERCCFGLSK